MAVYTVTPGTLYCSYTWTGLGALAYTTYVLFTYSGGQIHRCDMAINGTSASGGGFAHAGTYSFTADRYRTSNNTFLGTSSGSSKTVAKGYQNAPSAPTILGTGQTSIILNTVSGCEYKVGAGGSYQGNTTFAGLSPGTAYYFYQRLAATADYNASADSPLKIESTTKYTRAAPAAPSIYSATANSITLQTLSEGEYQVDGGGWQSSATFNGFNPYTTHSFCQRYAETSYYYVSSSSGASNFTTNKADQAAPAAPTAAAILSTSITLNTIANGEYKVGAGVYQASAVFNGLNSGTSYAFYQRYAETGSQYASPDSAAANISTLTAGGGMTLNKGWW